MAPSCVGRIAFATDELGALGLGHAGDERGFDDRGNLVRDVSDAGHTLAASAFCTVRGWLVDQVVVVVTRHRCTSILLVSGTFKDFSCLALLNN